MKSLQLDSPYLILLIGIPGSGKTYFAKQFSDLFSLPYINNLAGDFERISNYLLPEFLKTGKTIVLDVDTLTKKSREAYYNLAKKSGYKILPVWVQTDTDTSRNRAEKNAKLGGYSIDFDKSLSTFTLPSESESALVLSGKHTFATQTKIVLSKLIQPRVSLTTIQSKRI
jgi:predicted kinase